MFGMTDITKCANQACPFKENCWRFQCPPSGWQSYGSFSTPKKESDCEGYYPMSKEEIKRLKAKLQKQENYAKYYLDRSKCYANRW